MLFIFRKLRHSFFLPGKVRTYCAYAAGEIILIVVGILLALQISEWNQERRDRAEETRILLRLKEEYEENQRLLSENEESYRDISSELGEFLKFVRPDPELIPDELFHQGMTGMFRVPIFKPQSGVTNSLISSGKTALIKNERLNYQLNSWPSRVEKYDYEISLLNGIAERAKDFLLGHFSWKHVKVPYGSDLGPSHFSYDQLALLAMSEIESLAFHKRSVIEIVLDEITRLKALQQEILTILDTELAERGLDVEE